MRAIALAVIVSSVGLGAQQAAQTPPRDSPRPGAGSASVSGRVTDKDSGKPLRGFRVTVGRRAAGESRTFEAETDADGRFTITGLTPGEYYASVAPGEFRATHMGRLFGATDTPRAPFSPPPSFELKPGEIRNDLDFALDRTFAIEGRVLNDYGEGLADIEVNGERTDGQFGGTATVTTDDRGQFRVYSVARGSWRICAKPGNLWPGTPTGGDALEVRFVKTCFPTSGGSAAVVVESSDVAGVLVTMQRDRGYSLSGHVVDGSGTPVRNVRIEIVRLEPAGSYGAGPSISPEMTNDAFVARGLIPGDYVLRATVQDPPDPYAFRVGYLGPREMGLVTVRVEGSDVSGVVITTSRGVDVTGRIRFDGEPGMPLSPARIQVSAQRTRDAQRVYQNVMTPTASIAEDWSFELRRLFGPLVVMAYDRSGEWIIRSVRYGDTDVTGVPTEFKAGPGAPALEIALTNRTARVIARAVAADGAPAADAVVLLLPASPARWKSSFFGPTMAGKDGRFVMPPRAPGEYLIGALSGHDAARLMRNPDDLAEFATRAQRVTLDAGEHALDVKIVTPYEGR